MTPYEWTMGYPWDGNGGAFGELACWRISLALWTVALALLTAVAWALSQETTVSRGGRNA